MSFLGRGEHRSATGRHVLGRTPPDREAALCVPEPGAAHAAGRKLLPFSLLRRRHELIILICVAPYTSADLFQNVGKQMITSVLVAA